MSIIDSLKGLARNLYYGSWPEVSFDNTYPWLGFTFQELMKDEVCARKPMYIWGVIQGAALAKVLNIPEISVIEFGVAGGGGLLSLEHTADVIEEITDIHIFVYGFDTGMGHPKPIDHRDQPNMWFEGQLPMKKDVVLKRLHRASLRFGLVRDTVPVFVAEGHAPVAFASFDLDLYSSTRDALVLFEAPFDDLLPRVISYFDDIMGHSYNDFGGERLAISEFNCAHENRKLSPIYNLKCFVPGRFHNCFWWDEMYFGHFFDHPLYNEPDSLHKTVYADGHTALRAPINSDWRSRIDELYK
jgi:hypothetical protein